MSKRAICGMVMLLMLLSLVASANSLVYHDGTPDIKVEGKDVAIIAKWYGWRG